VTIQRAVTIDRSVRTAVEPSPLVMQAAAMFGLGIDDAHTASIVPPTRIPLPHPGGIVFITGPSGGGKSTILRLIRTQLEANTTSGDHGAAILNLDWLVPLPDQPLLDGLGHLILPPHLDDVMPARKADPPPSMNDGVDERLPIIMAALSLAGLGDAFVMLRRPRELSDGQQARLKITLAVLEVARVPDRPCFMLADEFGATLDRITAITIARNMRRWITTCNHDRPTHAGVTLLCATTHDDLLEALEPDVFIVKGLADAIEVHTR